MGSLEPMVTAGECSRTEEDADARVRARACACRTVGGKVRAGRHCPKSSARGAFRGQEFMGEGGGRRRLRIIRCGWGAEA